MLFLDCMSDAANVGRFVLEPLTSAEKKLESAQEVADRAVSSIGAELVGDFETMQSKLLNGHSLVFLMPDKSRCASFDTRTSEGRSIAEPPTSGVTKGPREGFVESYKSNLTLLKKRLKTPDFKVKTVEVGKYTATSVAVCYIDSIADMKIVNEIYEKISQIDMDGIIDSSYVAKFLDNDKSGLFKMVGSCEKPDIVVAKLLEGRVAIVVDGSPIVFDASVSFYRGYAVSRRLLRLAAHRHSCKVAALFQRNNVHPDTRDLRFAAKLQLSDTAREISDNHYQRHRRHTVQTVGGNDNRASAFRYSPRGEFAYAPLRRGFPCRLSGQSYSATRR